MTDETHQRTYYADDDLVEWIDKTAEKSQRSKSKTVNMILAEIKESVGGEPIDIHECEFKAE